MPSVYYGANEAVICKLAEICTCTEDAMFCTVYYAYIGSVQAVSDRMTVKCGSGWCQTTTDSTIRATLKKITDHLGKIKWYQRGLLDDNSNSLYPFFEKDVVGSIDTVPVDVNHASHTFQPKYASDVVKLVCTTTHTGFILQCSEPFQGAMHGNTALAASRFSNEWADGDKFLADGVFAATPHILVPYSGPQIWPKKKKDAGATQLRLQRNQMHAHFRARIEHQFGASIFNRFRLLWRFKGETDTLKPIVLLVVNVLNFELLFLKGTSGRYRPVSEYSADEAHALHEKFRVHESMSSRYPNPEEKKKRARK